MHHTAGVMRGGAGILAAGIIDEADAQIASSRHKTSTKRPRSEKKKSR